MFGMGHWELLIIFLVILLIFGAKRIPEMAQGLGKGIKEFRKAMHEVQDEIDVNSPPPRQQSQPRSIESTQADSAPASGEQKAQEEAPSNRTA